MLACDSCDELLGAYVLGACSEAEAEGIAEHLVHCTSCEATDSRLRQSAQVLLGDLPQASPPADIKERVMAQVRAEAALFEAARMDAGEPRGSQAAPSLGFRPRLPRVRLRARVPAAALASVLLLVAIGAGLLSGGLDTAPRRSVVAAQIEEGQPRGASGTLEIRGERAELRVRGLRSPGLGRLYQVWVRKHRQVPEPAGAAFEVDMRGAAQARLPGDIRRFDQILVTSEPAGGSRLPTRVPVLDIDTST